MRNAMKHLAFVLAGLALAVGIAPAAVADEPTRERELTCSDGTVFIGKQVRFGGGTPPRTWRNVESAAHPTAFTFHASTVTAPDGTVVESASFDHADGVQRNQETVTCGFVIPVGPFTGYQADFVGFFVPR